MSRDSGKPLGSGLPCAVLLAALGLVAGIFTLPILDRDEPRFGHASLEMIRRSDFIVPWFNGQPRLAKPPLSYWWMIADMKLFGTSEWTVRLHSAIAACLVGAVLAAFGKRLTGQWRGGLLAAGAWLTSLQVFMQGRVCTADMALVLAVTLSMRALWEVMSPDGCARRGWWWLLWLSMAAGFLAKGPVAWAVPLLARGIHAWRSRRHPETIARIPHLVAGISLCVSLCAAWGIPALIATHGRFFSEGIGHDIVERGASSLNGRLYLPGVFYLLTIPISLLPWTPLLPAAIRRFKEGTPAARFLTAWLIAPLLIFSFYATQLPHYILPGLPAFFLLVFCRVQPVDEPVPRRRTLPTTVLTGLSIGVMALLATAFGTLALRIPSVPSTADPRAALTWLAVLSALLAIASMLVSRNRDVPAIVVASLAGLVTIPGGKVLTKLNPSVLAIKVMDRTSGGIPLAVGYNEPSLVWCSDVTWRLNGRWEDAADQTAWRIVLMRSWKADLTNIRTLVAGRLPDLPNHDYRPVVAATGADYSHARLIHGWNLATSTWTELAVIPPAGSASDPDLPPP